MSRQINLEDWRYENSEVHFLCPSRKEWVHVADIDGCESTTEAVTLLLDTLEAQREREQDSTVLQ
jgi:hypothetical protein